MANQIVVSSGAKVRDLNDVIIGTSGVLSSLAFNVANGVPKLDVNGKILVSQLPNSVMEYKGTWDASTNTPTLVNGTGNQGDVYLCNVAGTVNFGAGPIAFFVGDQVIYSGTIWQRASGATGTVTSVGLTSTGNDAITITGSPITTSGNINLGFAGTNLQYINGAGDLTTFPTLISSIGLTMPSAFSVANSPLTSNGTIAVTGAGFPSQYIRGDGTLADFPTSGGGGSSVSYYLNGGTSQGTIGGVTYYEMSKTADTGTMADFSLTGNGFIVAFLTDAGDPAQLNIPAGNWNYEIYASMSANGGTPEMYAELYKYDGTTFTLIATSPHEILYDGTALNLYTFAMTVPSTTLAITDRLAVKLYATNSGGKTTTVHTQDSHLCQIITTFSTGITALNGLTAQVQYFATGTSGTDFNISSTTATHTFNIPSASATNRGLITTGSQTIAGDKAFTGINSFDYGINYKTGASLANVSGYISQAYATSGTGAGSTLSLKISDGNSVKAINLDFVGSPATYTYTFPAASGTLALLESTQTFSGVNTFSGLTSFTFSSGTRMDYGPYLTKGSVPTVFSGTTTNIYSDVTTNNIVIRDTSSSAKLLFDNSTQIYTFPAATGTIALTSNLSSYVPYTGATTNVTLGTNTLTAATLIVDQGTTGTTLRFKQYGSASYNTNGYTDIYAVSNSIVGFGLNQGSTNFKGFNFNVVNVTLNESRSLYIPDASGTIALLSGTQTFTGATTFSSNITVNSIQVGTAGNTTNIKLGGSTLGAITTGSNNIAIGTSALTSLTTSNANIGIGNSALASVVDGAFNTGIGFGIGGSITSGSNNALFGYGAGSSITTGNYNTIIGAYAGTAGMSNNIVLADGAGTIRYQWNGTNNAFTGAATFSSSVQADFLVVGTTAASSGGLRLGTQVAIRARNVANTANIPLIESTATDAVAIASGGANVGIGTSSPSAKLEIKDGHVRLYNATAEAGAGYAVIWASDAGGTNTSYATIEAATTSAGNRTGDIKFNTSSAAAPTERMRITSDGNVLIGKTTVNIDAADGFRFDASGGMFASIINAEETYYVRDITNSAYRFKVNGAGTVFATNTTISSISDERLKENIRDLNIGLDSVMKLKPRLFDWKPESKNSGKNVRGFIAQEVEEIFPDLIDEWKNNKEDENDITYKSLRQDFIPILVKAIQEQNQTITSLQDRLDKAGL